MKKIFLDLEGTVISDWWSNEIINPQLRQVLQDQEVTIFSFALLTEEDREDFGKRIKSQIENAFGFKVIDEILCGPLTDEIALKNHRHFFDDVDRIDFRNILGKGDFFLRFCERFKNSEIMLIDDSVEDKIVLQNGNRIELLKI